MAHAAAVLTSRADAQGIVSSAVRGTVRGEQGGSLEGARVRVTNRATGFAVDAPVRHGRFVVQGLEPGGPYLVEVRHVGYHPQQSAPVQLALGESAVIDFQLVPMAVPLDAVRVAEPRGAHPGGGAATTISESLVGTLPTLNRNFYDFVALAPQVSTKVGFGRSGVSAAGANLRFNSFLVNGADERGVNGSVSAAQSVGKSVPLDAVKEFQVLVAPYDVRYGDFAGALINTVTHSGTNELRGSAFGYWRNDRIARSGEQGAYERLQYGGALSGPVVRDRLHFFVASELQRLAEPATGPYAGQPGDASAPLPVSEVELARFDAIMRGHGLVGGSAGRLIRRTPLHSVFARMDGVIPAWNTRVSAFVTDARTGVDQFSRSAAPDTFALSSYRYASEGGVRLGSIQVRTDLPRLSAHNELVVSAIWDRIEQTPAVRQPLVRVRLPGLAGGEVIVAAGAAELAHGRFGRGSSVKVKDGISVPWGSRNTLVAGAQVERFSIRRGGLTGGYGTWTFSSLDALAQGIAERFELRKDFGSESTPLSGNQYAAYAGNELHVANRLVVTLGVRGDRLDVAGSGSYDRAIDSIFGRTAGEMPRRRVHVSPRLGFSWDPNGAGSHELRGGMGVFAGRPPLAWLVAVRSNNGVGNRSLPCGPLPSDWGPPPAFVTDYRTPPTRCATGPEIGGSSNGSVDLAARNLGLARALRGSLAYVRRAPHGIVITAEAVGTRYLSDFMFVNLNLPAYRAVDRFGRVIYGRIATTGVPDSVAISRFSQVIDLRNTSRNHSRQLSARVERQVPHGIAGALSYTHTRARDVQSPSRVNLPGITMWADARATSGHHGDPTLGISLNDVPHRVVAAATYALARRRWGTTLALYYVGESGSPFTYVATGLGRRGDLNADGSNANDPIYVPASAFDSLEIRFAQFQVPGDTVTVAEQAGAFEHFITASRCLKRLRGRIVPRNSCREPASHTTILSMRQAVPVARRDVDIELDAFNLLNLLNGSWGRQKAARPRLLEHVAQTSGATGESQPIFRFDPTRSEWETLPAESAFQFQIALRYRF